MTCELLDYWLQRPDTQGTEQMVVEWWLLEHAIQRSVDVVRPVLTELVNKGFVVKRHQADGRVYYMLNRNKEDEARTWLHPSTDGHA